MTRCHCGSEMIPLFQSFACKAECYLPLSMRTKTNESRAEVERILAGTSEPRSLPVQTPIWRPVAGSWVRTVDPGGNHGTVWKVTGVVFNPATGRDVAHGHTPDRLTMFSGWPLAQLEPWAPRPGERATVSTYHTTGTVTAIIGDEVDLEVHSVTYRFAVRDLEPAV
jgi:hypothetical protein